MSCAPDEAALRIPGVGGVNLHGCLAERGGAFGIFVHGFRSDASGTKSLTFANHALRRGYSWLRADLRGHGRSEGGFEDFRLSALLGDLLAFLDRFPVRPTALIGSSMGGWLATLAAERRPQVRALILLAPAFNFIQDQLGRLPEAELAAWKRNGRRRFSDDAGADYELDYAVLEDAQPFDCLHRAVSLSCPVHILHGARDDVVPVSVSQAFARACRAPKFTLMEIPDGDHRLHAALPLACAALDALWPASL
jgi:pimeloyl-ACP methyl ester carboxylesterase